DRLRSLEQRPHVFRRRNDDSLRSDLYDLLLRRELQRHHSVAGKAIADTCAGQKLFEPLLIGVDTRDPWRLQAADAFVRYHHPQSSCLLKSRQNRIQQSGWNVEAAQEQALSLGSGNLRRTTNL